MKKFLIGAMFVGFVMSASPAQANLLDSVVDTSKSVLAWCWNILPGSIRIVNNGSRWLCEKWHDGVDNTTEYIEIKDAE